MVAEFPVGETGMNSTSWLHFVERLTRLTAERLRRGDSVAQ